MLENKVSYYIKYFLLFSKYLKIPFVYNEKEFQHIYVIKAYHSTKDYIEQCSKQKHNLLLLTGNL